VKSINNHTAVEEREGELTGNSGSGDYVAVEELEEAANWNKDGE